MSGMDERALAAQIEAMRDDPAAWGEAEPAPQKRTRSERRQRGVVVSVRLTEAELAQINEYASGLGLSVSGALRDAALAAAARTSNVIFASARAQTTRVTSASPEAIFTTATNADFALAGRH
jgi:hypothetical protein